MVSLRAWRVNFSEKSKLVALERRVVELEAALVALSELVDVYASRGRGRPSADEASRVVELKTIVDGAREAH